MRSASAEEPAVMSSATGECGFAGPALAHALVAKAESLIPVLRDNAAEGETLRSPTPTVDRFLREAGFLSLLLPARCGGAALSFSDYARVQMALAMGDLSASWVSHIVCGTSWMASLASDAVQDILFASGPAAVCGAYNPPGRAQKVEGGWQVTGAWPYCSGSRQSDWAQLGVVLDGFDGPVTPGVNFVYMPMAEVTIRDTWFVTGLQGTGSDTIVADNVFVRDDLMVFPDRAHGFVEPGKRHYGAPGDSAPVVPVARATGLAQLVGGAAAMLELVEAQLPAKPIVTTTYRQRRESGHFLHDVGRVAAQIDTARLLLFDVTRLLDEAALAGQAPSDPERARHKAQCAQIVDLLHDAVEAMMFMAGSSAFATANPLSRFWRDLHMAFRHISNIPALGYEIYGRDRLRIDNITPTGAY